MATGAVCFDGEGCAGLTARISRVDVAVGTRTDVVTGLVSLGDPDGTGFGTVGMSGLAVQGNQVFAVSAGNPVFIPTVDACDGRADEASCRAVLGAAPNLGGTLRLTPGGPSAWRQNVGAFNYEWTADNKDTIPLPGWADNPDFQPGDANPYAATAAPGGIYVVDGGANTLTWVPSDPTAEPTVLAALPNPVPNPNPPPGGESPYDAVPTCVAAAGGKVVIGDLSGRLFVYDGSTKYPSPVTTSGTGFLASVGGCGSDGKGNVYVSDIFVGTVQRLSVKDLTLTPVAEGLTFPTGVAVAKDGGVYVANDGVCPSYLTDPIPGFCSGSGAVVRLHGR